VGDRVELRGYVGRAELDALYARATFALVPSRYEGFGYAVAEALCAGLDAVAWIDAARAVLGDRDAAERRAAAARPRAIARFAWSTAAARCAEIYARVLGTGARTPQ
jgi:glycosyltransferase involved in cell wall biosynthesis